MKTLPSATLTLFMLTGGWTIPLIVTSCGVQEKSELVEGSGQGFLERHWSRPLDHQGTPPPHLTRPESSLDPATCGECHPSQFADWSTTLHSRAMSPGLMGQLVEMEAGDREGQAACLRCHAPLGEQADSVMVFLADMAGLPGAGNTFPEAAIAAFERASDSLHGRGVICAACHMREFKIYGPPRSPELPPIPEGLKLPHDGWEARTEFEDSEFCASCHQFDPDDLAVNGKLLENTYEEWKASRFAREGTTCQSCHMPGRRHLFRGIHDPEMVQQGVTIEVAGFRIHSATVSAKLVITNTGTGHQFPTYVTPRIKLEGFQVDSSGRVIPETVRTYMVGWSLSVSLNEEVFDTRIPPGESEALIYEVGVHPGATALRFRIRVEPDNFYTRFYEAWLDGGFADRGRGLIEKALEESQATEFTLYESEHLLIVAP